MLRAKQWRPLVAINDNRKISDKEMGYMKNLFNAASSLTAIVNTFNKNIEYNNLSDMHQKLLEKMQPKKTPQRITNK